MNTMAAAALPMTAMTVGSVDICCFSEYNHSNMADNIHTSPPAPSASEVNGGEERRAAAAEMRRRLGEVVALMVFSGSHEHLFLSDLKWAVLPPLELQQYRLVRDKQGRVAAYVSWAWVDEETEQRLASGAGKLRPQEWRCGDRAVIMDLLAGRNSAEFQEKVLLELKEKVFSRKPLRALLWDAEAGRLALREVGAER